MDIEIINKLNKKHKIITNMKKHKEENDKEENNKEHPTIYSEAADIIIRKEAAIKKINKKLNTYKIICISLLSLLVMATLSLVNEWRKT